MTFLFGVNMCQLVFFCVVMSSFVTLDKLQTSVFVIVSFVSDVSHSVVQ